MIKNISTKHMRNVEYKNKQTLSITNGVGQLHIIVFLLFIVKGKNGKLYKKKAIGHWGVGLMMMKY